MKIDSTFKLREIAGETIIVNQGTPDVDMTRIISLNGSARLLWEQLSGKEFTVADAAAVLVSAYFIAEEQALADAQVWMNDLLKCGVITE